MNVGLPLMKAVLQPLPKSVLITLGLTTTESAADGGIHKKIKALYFLVQFNHQH